MSISAAEELLQQLERHYNDYKEGKGRRPRKKGFLQMLSHWVAYDVQDIAPYHEDFLLGVNQLTDRLAETLVSLSQEEQAEGGKLAVRAVELLLQPKPQQPQNDRDWYLMTAEYAAAPLLPFLSSEELQVQRDNMLAHTPRKLMYPKQLELLEAAEKLLGQ